MRSPSPPSMLIWRSVEATSGLLFRNLIQVIKMNHPETMLFTMYPYPGAPSMGTIPTSRPKVCTYYLLWAIWSPRDIVGISIQFLNSHPDCLVSDAREIPGSWLPGSQEPVASPSFSARAAAVSKYSIWGLQCSAFLGFVVHFGPV